ncbi:hypothetical protein QO004_002897 [Rhizobium mesoamericanum]|nr:hypothetical protein [Rhizobium mesoamericanum]
MDLEGLVSDMRALRRHLHAHPVLLPSARNLIATLPSIVPAPHPFANQPGTSPINATASLAHALCFSAVTALLGA